MSGVSSGCVVKQWVQWLERSGKRGVGLVDGWFYQRFSAVDRKVRALQTAKDAKCVCMTIQIQTLTAKELQLEMIAG